MINFVNLRKQFLMRKEELKKELHTIIDNIDDEELLNIVKEDIAAYQTEAKKDFDDLSYLTSEERKELEELATEEPEKDTIRFEEYQKEMKEWLSKL